QRVLALIRQTRGGALYRSAFGERQTGSGPYAEMLAARFARAIRALGLDRRQGGTAGLETGLFRVPASAAGGAAQLELF
ncbi:MAG: radical SAM protein, partial [Rhodovarius sp.]|nr:radical SAM protein [Rhodovarius sp.]